MQNMNYYYDFSGQKFGYPLSLSINSFDRQVFSRQTSLEISYVLKGNYEVTTEHFTSPIKEHEMVIIAPNDIHMIHPASQEETVILTIHVDFARFSEPIVGNVKEAFESILCTQHKNRKLLEELEHKIGNLIGILLEGNNNLFQLNAFMMELVYSASNHQQYPIERLPLQSEHSENYMKAIQYIDKHYQQALRLEDVATTLSFSTSYTSKLFKKYTGISFVKYLSYVRVRASLEAVLEGKDTIESISAQCGMANSKAYTVAFKELYGIVPSDYRKRFARNLQFQEIPGEQKMSLSQEHHKLLEHLLVNTKELLYDQDGITITNTDGHLVCCIMEHPEHKSVITHTPQKIIIDITPS